MADGPQQTVSTVDGGGVKGLFAVWKTVKQHNIAHFLMTIASGDGNDGVHCCDSCIVSFFWGGVSLLFEMSKSVLLVLTDHHFHIQQQIKTWHLAISKFVCDCAVWKFRDSQ